jgi:hypothetical protein
MGGWGSFNSVGVISIPNSGLFRHYGDQLRIACHSATIAPTIARRTSQFRNIPQVNRTRKRWPYHPWQKAMAMDEQRAELAEVAAVFKTRAPVNTAGGGAAHTVRDLRPI